MRWLDAIVLRLRTALRRDRANRDLDAEIAFYLEQEVEKNLARGLSPGKRGDRRGSPSARWTRPGTTAAPRGGSRPSSTSPATHATACAGWRGRPGSPGWCW